MTPTPAWKSQGLRPDGRIDTATHDVKTLQGRDVVTYLRVHAVTPGASQTYCARATHQTTKSWPMHPQNFLDGYNYQSPLRANYDRVPCGICAQVLRALTRRDRGDST